MQGIHPTAIRKLSGSCPLCGKLEAKALLQIPFGNIWRRLCEERSAIFSPDVVHRHTPQLNTTLYACFGCGLQYFSPAIPGDAEYYARLMKSPVVYYEPRRWEFGVVANRVQKEDIVLDVGCGSGAFLREIADQVARVVGIDQNAEAVAELRSAGIEAYACNFESFSRLQPATFNLACAFHVLEHYSQVEKLVEPLLRCMKPGGRIYLSVPNRERYARNDLDPLDCPPHHMSRWEAAQFRVLASRFGLELLDILYEEPDRSVADLVYLCDGRRLFSFLGARAAGFLARVYRKILMSQRGYARAVRSRRFTRRGLYGHSILAELECPN